MGLGTSAYVVFRLTRLEAWHSLVLQRPCVWVLHMHVFESDGAIHVRCISKHEQSRRVVHMQLTSSLKRACHLQTQAFAGCMRKHCLAHICKFAHALCSGWTLALLSLSFGACCDGMWGVPAVARMSATAVHAPPGAHGFAPGSLEFACSSWVSRAALSASRHKHEYRDPTKAGSGWPGQ